MTEREENQQETINWRVYLRSITDIWYAFVISFIICVLVGYLYTKSTPLQFEASSSLLIEKDKKGMSADDIMSGFGLFNAQQNIENEIAVLSSYSIAERAIISTNNYVKYYKKEQFRKDNIYKKSPFLIIIDSLTPQYTGMYKLSYIDNERVRIKRESGGGCLYDYLNHKVISEFEDGVEVELEAKLNEWTKSKNFRIMVVKNEGIYESAFPLSDEYCFSMNDLNSLTEKLMESVKAEAIHKQADVISIKLRSDNPEEAVDLLNALTSQYFLDNLGVKNKMAGLTIEFIDNQLGIISDSLKSTEFKLESFRKENKIVNVVEQSSSVVKSLEFYETKLAMAQLRKKYFEYLVTYINKERDYSDILVPSVMDVNDPMLTKLISDLMTINSQKIKIQSNSTVDNPLLQTLDQQILEIKRSITESVNSLSSSSDIEISELRKQISSFESEMNKIPEKERLLIGIERSFTINNEIYTYLLQKRAESSIAQASNMPDGRLIDQARLSMTEQTKPRTSLILLISGLLGLALPFLYILIKRSLFDYVEERGELESFLDVSVLGTIPHSDLKSNFIIRDHPKSFVAESFRSVRTSLKFMLDSEKTSVILVSSSIPGEGKTFNSVNLAQVIAATNKKTLIIGLDLRNPGLTHHFYPKNTLGISTYLTGQSTLEESIQHTEDPNLDIFTSGPVPPNPSELVGSQKMKDLIMHLRSKYDYIVIDTPPINLTTDALQVISEVDAFVFVVRYKYTR
ncbi:MAG: polysaccharide biosynthesis tyrosine autokinase, partial [Bacteroidales bacterium]|nr:polysaccharide biosynthesis tyrosine autokinase [Bacteroidales bacterium]